MPLMLICNLLALVCFLLGAAGAAIWPRVNWVALGLALWMLGVVMAAMLGVAR